MAELTGTGYGKVIPIRRTFPNMPNLMLVMAEPVNFKLAELVEKAEPIEEVQLLGAKSAEPEALEIAEPVPDIAEPSEKVEPEPTQMAETEQVAELETVEIAEPEVELEQIAEPEPLEIAEPPAIQAEVQPLENEITEPVPLEVPDIAEPGEEEEIEISTEGFKEQASRLWNLTTYKDRHGKLRAKRVLRFVTHPPKSDLGVVDADLAGRLERRRGRGRWKSSRGDAEELKASAELVAEAYNRDRRHRRD